MCANSFRDPGIATLSLRKFLYKGTDYRDFVGVST